jgi:hypothetical protein
MRNLFLVFILCFAITSCGNAEQIKKLTPTKIIKIEIPSTVPELTKEDLKKLVFKTELSKEEKVYFQKKANEFSGKIKQFAK